MSLKDVKFIATDMDHTLLTEASVLPPRFQDRLDAWSIWHSVRHCQRPAAVHAAGYFSQLPPKAGTDLRQRRGDQLSGADHQQNPDADRNSAGNGARDS